MERKKVLLPATKGPFYCLLKIDYQKVGRIVACQNTVLSR